MDSVYIPRRRGASAGRLGPCAAWPEPAHRASSCGKPHRCGDSRPTIRSPAPGPERSSRCTVTGGFERAECRTRTTGAVSVFAFCSITAASRPDSSRISDPAGSMPGLFTKVRKIAGPEVAAP
jgi:hypothetical protein